MSGIGVILNPYSKKFKKDPNRAKHMGFIVGDKASCKETEDLDDLRRVAEEFKTRDIDILAINGGDGTNHCTLTTFLQVYGEKPLPKIALLRGGTLNTVARSVGVKGRSEDILSNLLVKYHEDIPFETRDLLIMKINNEYGFIFGIGTAYSFMELYYKNNSLSPLLAAKTAFHAIGSCLINGKLTRGMFERFNAEVTVNNQTWPFKNYSSLLTGSINQLGLDFKAFYLAEKFPGKFHALGVSCTPRSLLKYLPVMFMGKPSGNPDLIEDAASEMTIKLEKPLPYMIDGDMKKDPVDHFHISCGPVLKVLVK